MKPRKLKKAIDKSKRAVDAGFRQDGTKVPRVTWREQRAVAKD